MMASSYLFNHYDELIAASEGRKSQKCRKISPFGRNDGRGKKNDGRGKVGMTEWKTGMT
jgi:hypothetical protein